MLEPERLQANLESVKARIAAAAQQAGRAPQDVSLVVVTKGHPAETLRSLQALGIRHVGESYAQEGRAKQKELASLEGLHWHMIGHVQSRKAEQVAKHFDLVHAVDSLRLAARLDRCAAQAGKLLPILLEVNVSGEASKYGWPAADERSFQAAIPDLEKILQLQHVLVRGLMSMAPLTQNPAEARPHFAHTRTLRDELKTRFPQGDWSQLSMGMSADFEAAILEGASLVRIGTAVLGPRPY
ncbi:MAG TPA: YggS family pyridoxal phosphate-dependent enzyme [Anaerolineales bacterium]|nr:YggS family pyridoxal phosphate-dependent enzyme [Anaerolineales bacterium]